MNRKLMVTIHLVLAGFFLPYLLIMPLSGTLYLLDEKGSEKRTLDFTVEKEVPVHEKEKFFRQIFADQNNDYAFEYIKGNDTNFLFRPTTRVFYSAEVVDSKINFYKIEPNLTKRLMELHKGHGPRYIRLLEIGFGLALLLITLSGLWLAITVNSYRNSMAIATLLGLLAVSWALF